MTSNAAKRTKANTLGCCIDIGHNDISIVSESLSSIHREDIGRYAKFIQRDFVRGVLRLWFEKAIFSCLILTGDAGSGKTTVIQDLENIMFKLGLRRALALCAPTHRACCVMGERSTTYQSLLGINLPMCLMPFDEFVVAYSSFHRNAIATFKTMVKDTTEIAARARGRDRYHACFELNMRCIKCLGYMRQVMFMGCTRCPKIVGKSLVVLDEYGLLSAQAFKKILWVIKQFSLPEQGPLLIFSGSCTQLPSPDLPPLWAVPAFPRLVFHTTNLLINFRQIKDPEYSKVLTLMQYNIVTKSAQEIMDSRVIGMGNSYNPLYEPSVIRIFTDNARKNDYNKAACRGKVHLTLSPTFKSVDISENEKKCTLDECYEHLYVAFGKRFTRSDKGCVDVYIGGLVTMPTSIDKSCKVYILTSVDKSGGSAEVEDCGNKVTVDLHVHRYKNWQITFMPLYPISAINAYCAQGATIEGGVSFNPPAKTWEGSPMKPACYVAASRVPTRNRFFLSHNNFARFPTTDGKFFHCALVDYKKIVEQCYAPLFVPTQPTFPPPRKFYKTGPKNAPSGPWV